LHVLRYVISQKFQTAFSKEKIGSADDDEHSRTIE